MSLNQMARLWGCSCLSEECWPLNRQVRVAHAHPMPNTTRSHVLIVLRTCGQFSSTSEIHTVGLLDFTAREVSNHRAPLDHDGFAAGRTFSGHRFFIACSLCLAFPSTIVWQLPRQQAWSRFVERVSWMINDNLKTRPWVMGNRRAQPACNSFGLRPLGRNWTLCGWNLGNLWASRY